MMLPLAEYRMLEKPDLYQEADGEEPTVTPDRFEFRALPCIILAALALDGLFVGGLLVLFFH